MNSSNRSGQSMNSLVRWCAVVTAAATFFLIIVGALVTSNDAGDSVPDWPTSFGKVVPVGQIVGNVVYEYSHRVVAAVVGLLTIGLNLLLWHREERRWVRRVGLFALAAVVAQGLLGGARVLLLEYRFPAAMAHAFLAQFFFCLTVGLATLTSPTWMMAVDRKVNVGSLRTLGAVTVGALFVQLLLGAAFRHRGLGILPHIVGAVVVSILIVWVVVAVFRQTKRPGGTAVMIRLRRPALFALVLLMAQLTLGVFAYFARVASQFDPQPLPPMVWLTVAHVACGAFVLAVVLMLTLRIFHLSVPPDAVAEFGPTAQRATS